MFRRIVGLQAVISAVLMGLVGLFIAAGSYLQLDKPALEQDDDCRLPCWNGIIPGQTLYNQARQIVIDQGYTLWTEPDGLAVPGQVLYIAPDRQRTVCKVGFSRTRMMEAFVREMALWFCEPQDLGDLMPLLGTPHLILPLTSLLTYNEGQIVLILTLPVCDRALSPRSTVRYISLADASFNAPLFNQPVQLGWRGFMPMWRYGQLEAGGSPDMC